jgi:hypothetical protein
MIYKMYKKVAQNLAVSYRNFETRIKVKVVATIIVVASFYMVTAGVNS